MEKYFWRYGVSRAKLISQKKCNVNLFNEYGSAVLCLVTQSCPTLCNPMDRSPPGSYVHGILQARILEWVAMPISGGSFQPGDQTQVSPIAGGFFTLRHKGSSVSQ